LWNENAQQADYFNRAQQQLFGENATSAAFANQAQQQTYDQLLGRATFGNTAQQQQFGQNLAGAQFTNAGLAQQLAQQQSGFNAQQSQLNEYLQQQYAARNQAINETTALLSGSQVAAPNWLNTPSSQIATTDIGGLINQNFAQQFGNYQAQNTNINSLLGGALGLGAGAIRSDRKVKENIDRIGTVFSANVDKEEDPPAKTVKPVELPIYQYSYKDDPASVMHVGPMAQDVQKSDRRAVRTIRGVKTIDPKRVMGNILRAS
jgi:hypothetical protein